MGVDGKQEAAELRDTLIALNEVSRLVATSLLEDEDLNRSIGRILAGVGRALGVSRALLYRYRDQGRTVLRTHEWAPEEGELQLFMPGALTGTKPKGGRLEWQVIGRRERAALNENFARELPLEYRAILKDYYERLTQ